MKQCDKPDVYYYPLNIPISTSLKDIIEILNTNGKRALIVGGAVRDAITGDVSKDIDVEVYATTYPELQEVLSQYLKLQKQENPNTEFKGHADFAGKEFGVVIFSDLQGNRYDFSIPRRENKRVEGGLHTDFDIVPDPTMTPRDAAARRDFTWNSLAYDPLTCELHDYFGGVNDIENRIIRHTSEQFSEDPLRVLRGMQFASRFGFDVDPETAALSRKMADQFPGNTLIHENRGVEQDESGNLKYTPHLAQERIAEEFMKFAAKGVYPGKILDYLVVTGWIRFFPLLEAMHRSLSEEYLSGMEHKALYDGNGVPQDPDWHPEGNLWEHTRQTMDAAAAIASREGIKEDRRAVFVFAAMLHDIGKAGMDEDGSPITRLRDKNGKMRWTAYGHEQASGILAEQFLQRIGIKSDIVSAVKALVSNHLVTVSMGTDPSEKSINNLARKLHKSKTNIETLMHLIEADQSGRVSCESNSDEAEKLQRLEPSAQKILDKARELGVALEPMPPFIQGRDIQMVSPDLKPGPVYGHIINRFYALQTSGSIKTREEALLRLKAFFDKKKAHQRVDGDDSGL